MTRARVKGLLDKADRMGWFLLGPSDFHRAKSSWRAVLEGEHLDLNEKTLRWTRGDWYRLFVIPLFKEAQKRKKNKEDFFIYLKLVENLSIKDIAEVFSISPYAVVKELFYFLLEDTDITYCKHSRSIELITSTFLDNDNQAADNSVMDSHVEKCSTCKNINNICYKKIYRYKKSISISNREFFEHHQVKDKPRKTLKLFGLSSLFS